VTAAVLKKLAGQHLFEEDESCAVYGTAYTHFEELGLIQEGKEACRAIGRCIYVCICMIGVCMYM